jgi:hypothetical protein
MTSFFVCILLSSFAFAGETNTDCKMMRESDTRKNPKENINSKKPGSSKGNQSSGQ